MQNTQFDPALLQEWHDRACAEGYQCVLGAVIINERAEAFVQKRSLERRLFPGCWDIVGGHIEAREKPYDGLYREILEETGWQLQGILSILAQCEWGIGQERKREIDVLVEVQGDLAHPQIEWGKHSEFRWMNLDEIGLLKENRQPGDTLIYDVVKKGLQSVLKLRSERAATAQSQEKE